MQISFKSLQSLQDFSVPSTFYSIQLILFVKEKNVSSDQTEFTGNKDFFQCYV